MKELTTRERMALIFNHQEPDRIPMMDSPWQGTLSRWKREGMPEGVDYTDYFGLDKIARFQPDNSPRYEAREISNDGIARVYTTKWGTTQRELIGEDTTPEFLDYKVNTPEAWEEAKARMIPTPDRINWDYLKKNYPIWEEQGYWKYADFWFGFDVTHSWMAGTETILMAMIEEPEWCVDMFNTYLDVCIALYEKVLDQGYKFDAIWWWDDMGYKHNQFFSRSMYRELLKPVHQRAIDWAHSKGMKAQLHSCGDVNPFIPDLVDMGLDALNPLEVKAGMEPLELKAKYGDKLVLHGGIDALLWNEPERMEAEMRRLIPELKKNGGYIFATDHSIPNVVSLEQFREVVALYKELGSY